MGMKKIKKSIEAYANDRYDKGYDEGYDQGYAEGYNDASDSVFAEGVKAERKRVIGLFRMLSENEMETGTGTKAKFWRDAAETVKIADDFEVYDEEGESLDV